MKEDGIIVKIKEEILMSKSKTSCRKIVDLVGETITFLPSKIMKGRNFN